ncbi:MAG: hypothetical protein AAF989_07190 [Planctomycetota bacterium]
MATSLISDEQPIDPNDERLVAYLDGELDLEARNQLESDLIEDESLRLRLQQLQEGWELLDDLPDSTPSEKLVETTMEMVAADLSLARSNAGPPWRRVPMLVWLPLVCLLSAGVSYLVLLRQRQLVFDSELQDLALVENLEAYLDGKDLELMRLLANNPEWRRMMVRLDELDGAPETEGNGLADVSLANREAFVDEMERDRLGALSARWESFKSYSPQAQQKIRETASIVDAQTDGDRLLSTMRLYSVWRSILPSQMVDAIELRVTSADAEGSSGASENDPSVASSSDPDGNVDERAAEQSRQQAIQAAMELTQERINRQSVQLLSEDGLDNIMIALEHILDERMRSSNSEFARRIRRLEEIFRRDSDPTHRRKVAIAMMTGEITFRGRDSSISQGLTDSEVLHVEQVLPLEDLELLNAWANDGTYQSSSLLRASILSAWSAAAARRALDEDRFSTRERYEMLSEDQRLRLDLSPPSTILRELSRRGGPPPGASSRPPSGPSRGEPGRGLLKSRGD